MGSRWAISTPYDIHRVWGERDQFRLSERFRERLSIGCRSDGSTFMTDKDENDILAKIRFGSIPILIPCSRFWASVTGRKAKRDAKRTF